MPGWPTVDRAADQQLVEALSRTETDAPAKLYDSYAERLHDYAFSLAGADDLAADAVHDALVTAQECVSRLKDPGRLRPWLYALTRFQVRARLARRPGTPAGGLPLPELDEHEDPELADLVHETLGELSGGEREVLELSVRHDLTPAEVAAVLGLTSRQAAARLGRARDHLEIAAAAVVLARVGRAHCPDLSAMVDSWEGPLTPLLRRRLSGHIGGCEVCTERRHRQVSAARLLDMVPVAYPRISLRRRVIDTCVKPELDQTRVLITDLGDDFDRTGFPVPADRRSRRRRPRRVGPLVLAGVCLLAATGAMVVINGGESSDTTALRPAPSPTLPVEESPTPEPYEDEEEPEPTPTPTPSRTRTPDAPPAVTRPGNRLGTRPATGRSTRPAPTRRRAAPGARLGASCPDGIDGAAKIGLNARNAAVSWVATASQGLDVFPASGSIKRGASVTLMVTVVDPTGSGRGRVAFTSNGGTATCSLSWRGQELPNASDPPTDEPTVTGEPTSGPDSPDQELRTSSTGEPLHD
ncbi:RNA polymerase sigma factor (sigma-70 family) [Nonomuraea fuscirosea]|uniref:RNA polymerase sigma factor (Sigma-70 family) n=1 Tax=Nonomuraea fuscirosea TaxID=1291556 RepID=A0A2T0MLY0_9ACTN|nr:sigma-70 family RNA polymerase sigma factor [Nonomuraea fuscirosea]PRX58705.1 RNA polymerase sigma factor (sigma-70 family) [Nonomuraea fuscirosea]